MHKIKNKSQLGFLTAKTASVATSLIAIPALAVTVFAATSMTANAESNFLSNPGICVTATLVEHPDYESKRGWCDQDTNLPGGGNEKPEIPDPTEPPIITEPTNPPVVPDPTDPPTAPADPKPGDPGDKSHLPNPLTTENYMVTKWDTSAESFCSTINLPIKYGTGDVSVNWGDGTTDTRLTSTGGLWPTDHTYNVQGIRYIVVKGSIESWGNLDWEDSPCLLEVPIWTDKTYTKKMSYAFQNTNRLTHVERIPDTVEYLDHAFENSTFNGSLDQWIGRKVITTHSMFKNAKNFNHKFVLFSQEIRVAESMFEGATSMNSYVTLDGMNRGVNLNNTSKMFKNASAFNAPLQVGDGAYILTTESMFENATSFNQDLTLQLYRANTTKAMFKNATAFNGNLTSMRPGWNTNYSEMFMNATSFNKPLREFTSMYGANMTSMFEGASSFNQDLYLWNPSKVYTMSRMFWNASSFKQDISKWDLDSANLRNTKEFSNSVDRTWIPNAFK